MVNLLSTTERRIREQQQTYWSQAKIGFLGLFFGVLLLCESIRTTADLSSPGQVLQKAPESVSNTSLPSNKNESDPILEESGADGDTDAYTDRDADADTDATSENDTPTNEQNFEESNNESDTIENTIENAAAEIDYDYTFLRYPVEYKTKFPLPDWMEEFMSKQPTGDPQKHQEMLNDPSSKFLVMVCFRFLNDIEDCGGLTDRLMNLPWNMWVAHKTNRKLLIKYHKPRPLEEFLVPPPPSDHGFNWILPDGYFSETWDEWGNRDNKKQSSTRRWIPTVENLSTPEALQKRAIFINNNLVGKDAVKRLEGMGEWSDDMWQGLFFRFFQPSREVARRLDLVTEPLQLEAGTYSSAHVRAKFPMRSLQKRGYLKYHQRNWYKADKAVVTVDMTNNSTQFIVSDFGNRAVACAVRVMPETKYVYAASDIKELIEYLKADSPYWADDDTKKVATTISWEAFDYEAAMSNQTNETEAISSEIHGWGVSSWEVPTSAKVIMRHDYMDPSVHFDQKIFDESVPGLFGAIVDYWMLAHAAGHSVGVGGFGRFGSVLAGNNLNTRARHRDYEDISPSCATSAERKAWKQNHPELYTEGRKKRRQRRRRRLHRTRNITKSTS